MATGDTTAVLMLSRFTALELSQRCSGDYGAIVTPALFRSVIEGGDISGEPQDTQDAVNAAVAVLNRAVSDANSEKAVYLSGYTINADADAFISNKVSDLARFYLQDNTQLKADDVIYIRYQQAVELLKSGAGCSACRPAGLGDVDQETEGNLIDAVFYTPDRIFTDSAMERY